MNMSEFSKLQVYSVEQERPDGGTCVVRCIEGVVRVGQVFQLEGGEGSEEILKTLTLDRIERYGRFVEFFDPPHNALVHLSGGPLAPLRYGDVLASRPDPRI